MTIRSNVAPGRYALPTDRYCNAEGGMSTKDLVGRHPEPVEQLDVGVRVDTSIDVHAADVEIDVRAAGVIIIEVREVCPGRRNETGQARLGAQTDRSLSRPQQPAPRWSARWNEALSARQEKECCLFFSSWHAFCAGVTLSADACRMCRRQIRLCMPNSNDTALAAARAASTTLGRDRRQSFALA